MFCTACGTKNAADSRYCKQCGHHIDNMSAGRVREEDFDRALPEDEQISALLERAYRARKAGDSAQAIALCQEALLLRPESTTAHSLLGQIYEGLGEHEMAIREYERVLQLNPGSIADRVKLDELRSGDLPAMRGTPPPQIVFADQNARQSAGQIAGWVALCGVLMLIGGGLTALWRGHNTPVAVTSGSQPPVNGGQTALTATGANSGVQAPGAANEGQKAPVAVGPSTYNPYLWNTPPPIIIQTPDTRSRTEQAVANAGSGRLSPAEVRLPAPGKTDAARNNRIYLDPDPADDKGDIKIQVDDKDTKGKGKPAPAHTPGTGSVSVFNSGSSSGGKDNSQPASYDARSFIAAGDEQRQNGDYEKALQSYTKALGSAGDELASVYQQIAHCYQLRGDKVSAIANYKSAITEYHKLVDAKKQPEFAEDGIRVCEKAIKACNY